MHHQFFFLQGRPPSNHSQDIGSEAGDMVQMQSHFMERDGMVMLETLEQRLKNIDGQMPAVLRQVSLSLFVCVFGCVGVHTTSLFFYYLLSQVSLFVSLGVWVCTLPHCCVDTRALFDSCPIMSLSTNMPQPCCTTGREPAAQCEQPGATL